MLDSANQRFGLLLIGIAQSTTNNLLLVNTVAYDRVYCQSRTAPEHAVSAFNN